MGILFNPVLWTATGVVTAVTGVVAMIACGLDVALRSYKGERFDYYVARGGVWLGLGLSGLGMCTIVGAVVLHDATPGDLLPRVIAAWCLLVGVGLVIVPVRCAIGHFKHANQVL